ncbi:PilW family protein [Desulfobulbus sp. F4]|nr:PilW family protein [Desulfobulbus sp. F4]
MSDMKRKYLKSNGFTLIELMIAIAMVSLLAGAMYSVYSIQQKSYTVQEQVTEMQQKMRSALDIMTRDLRMAGYDPQGTCSPEIREADAQKIIFDICDPMDPDDPNRVVFGIHRITYQFDKGEKRLEVLRDENKDGTVVNDTTKLVDEAESIADGVEAVELQYFDEPGIILTPPVPLPTPVVDPTKIRAVRISILVRSSYPNPKYIDTALYEPASVLAAKQQSPPPSPLPIWDINGGEPGEGNPPNTDKCNEPGDRCHYHRYLLITTIKLRNMGL